MSELDRARKQLRQEWKVQEAERLAIAKKKQEEEKRAIEKEEKIKEKIKSDYERHIKPLVLAANKRFMKEVVPDRVLRIIDEAVNEIQTKERVQLEKETTFKYELPGLEEKSRTFNFITDEQGNVSEYDLKDLLHLYNNGRVLQTTQPQQVELRYSKQLSEEHWTDYVSVSESYDRPVHHSIVKGISLGFRITSKTTELSRGSESPLRFSHTSKGSDLLAKWVAYINDRNEYRYERTS